MSTHSLVCARVLKGLVLSFFVVSLREFHHHYVIMQSMCSNFPKVEWNGMDGLWW